MIQIPLISFYFLRHGETDWNKNRIYMGSQDIPLNDVGRSQASLVYKYVKGKGIDHIVSSPLSRALETAQIINKQMGVPITILDELQECNLGIVEGKPYDDGTMHKKWMDGSHGDGESRIEFEERVMNGVKKALQLSQNVLIVSHGGVYSCLSRMMGWPVVKLNNCEVMSHNPPIHHAHAWSICSLLEGKNL